MIDGTALLKRSKQADEWSRSRSLVPPSGRGPGTTKFFLYVIVAFGIPLVTVGISVFIELHFEYVSLPKEQICKEQLAFNL